MALKYLYVPSGTKAEKAYGVLPNSANADFSSFSRSSAGSRVDKNGLIDTGLGLGGEEIVNGDFDTDSDWIKQDNWQISNGKANTSSAITATAWIYQLKSNTYDINKVFEISADIVVNSGSCELGIGSAFGSSITESGTYSFTLTMPANHTFAGCRAQTGFEGSVDNISVREVTEVNTDVPRLDYTGGGCPSLLLEPTSTNYLKYSEDFSQSYWKKESGNQVINPNVEISPSGTLTADKLTVSSGTITTRKLWYPQSTTVGLQYTFSVYIKAVSNQVNTGFISIANLDTHINQTFFTATDVWQRVVVTATSNSAANIRFLITGDPNCQIYIWGAQAEQGSYPTSYIKSNSGSATTRVADDGNGTGDISSAINEEEGVFFIHSACITSEAISTPQWVSLSEGSSNNSYISIRYNTSANSVQIRYQANGGSAVSISTTITDRSDFNKIAFRWKANDFSLWINGSLIQTQTTWDIITANNLNRLSLELPSGGQNFYGRCKEIRVYDEALSDTELQELTTL